MARTDEFIHQTTSWEKFISNQRDCGDKEKGDNFERLVQLFLQLDPLYAAQLKNVWLLSEVSHEVREKLNLPEPDKGIDLVAETHSGEFWAIQSKYRDDQTSSVTWDELSTFTGLAFGVCRNIAFGLVCSTTEHITQVLQNNERIGFCSIEAWAHLDADFFRRARAKVLHQVAALEPYQPREHQRDAIAGAKEHFLVKNETRGKLIMPCASGKSLTAFWIAWRPFDDARKFARSLELRGQDEWIEWTRGKSPNKPKRPLDVPLSPATVYTQEWEGWRDWLGTDFLPFEDARDFARKSGVTSQRQWRAFREGKIPGISPKPDNIPSAPDLCYQNEGWAGWADWFGTNNKAPRLISRPFAEARQFARALGLSSPKQWDEFCRGELPQKGKLPSDIPSHPNRYYQYKGWIDWGDWLNCDYKTTHRKSKASRFIPYEETRKFVHPLKIASETQWKKYSNGERPDLGSRPADIPANPRSSYLGKGWKGWGDFLGSGSIAPIDKKKIYLPFEQAREFTRTLGLKSSVEWYKYRVGSMSEKPPLPYNIPKNPKSIYKKSWINYQDWLGAPDKESRWRPFEPARAWARTLGLRTARDWFRYCDGEFPEKVPPPPDIPKDVYTAYEKKGWKGMHDWLGVV